MNAPIIDVKDLKVYFSIRKGIFGKTLYVKAVDGVDLSICEKEIITVVGESGCGKTTLGKTIAGLIKPTGGKILYKGKDLRKLSRMEYKEYRRLSLIHI